MKEFKLNEEVRGLVWEVSAPKGVIVISHGMAEHASRYDRFAKELNKHNYTVYAIDQIGHGVPPLGKKGHFEKGDFNKCADHINELVKDIRKNTSVKVILFGHSMGSFIAQEYIADYGDSINACVLSGTNGPQLLFHMGKVMATLSSLVGKKDKENHFMNGLSFGSYNKAFAPNRTEFDWLSRDEKEVDKYIKDPDCGYCCTSGFFKEFMRGLSALHTSSKIKKIPQELPIYIMSGSLDPVGAAVGGTEKLFNLYKKVGIKDVKHKLYPEGRHEMLNEINRDEVTKDLIEYFDSIK